MRKKKNWFLKLYKHIRWARLLLTFTTVGSWARENSVRFRFDFLNRRFLRHKSKKYTSKWMVPLARFSSTYLHISWMSKLNSTWRWTVYLWMWLSNEDKTFQYSLRKAEFFLCSFAGRVQVSSGASGLRIAQPKGHMLPIRLRGVWPKGPEQNRWFMFI